MGCANAKEEGIKASGAQWEKCVQVACKRPAISSGGNKDIHAGFMQGRQVAICIARTDKQNDRVRLQQEIKIFKMIGRHTHIINLLYSGKLKQRPYLVLEAVEPIGYDLNRLVNQYSWAGQPVPALLTARLMRQLAMALGHMHSKSIIHRDLKTENVLINDQYDAKLIDMGIACAVGTTEKLAAPYLAPELIDGKAPLGPEVDCWGLGVVLHQIYQFRWDLMDIRTSPPRLRKGMPCSEHPMETFMQEMMMGLLQTSATERMTLEQLKKSPWLEDTPQQVSRRKSFLVPTAHTQGERSYLREYLSAQPPLTAYAAKISPDMSNLVDKKLKELEFGSKYHATVLLIDYGKEVERFPGSQSVLKAGCWVYFGVPQDEGMDAAVSGLKQVFLPDPNAAVRNVSKRGTFLPFTLEFDCFTFPKHIGDKAVIGNVGQNGVKALAMRHAFTLNLAGIVRPEEAQPEWFPGASTVVRPGDLGLVVRVPQNDGSTKPTIQDSDIAALMEPKQFDELMKKHANNPASA